MIKCIVCDLDGTLFYGFGNDIYDLSPESVKALDMMKENGIEHSLLEAVDLSNEERKKRFK